MKDIAKKEKKQKPARKVNSNVLSRQKRTRRRLLTLYRMGRYGVDSFLRNSWLSVAATIVMTMTLLVIFVSVSARTILNDTVADLTKKVDMSIYLKTETTDKVGADLTSALKKLSTVRTVKYISAAAAREQIIADADGNDDILDAITEATNKNPATLRVVIRDIDNTAQLEKFVASNKLVKEYLSADYKPSFAGERRNTIKSIGRVVKFAQNAGIAAGVLFVVISSLIIFNTIRMAIFNRKEEIQMMKLIGADKSFIRGPFLIESIIYGFIAAMIATGLGYWALLGTAKVLASYQIVVASTIDLAVGFWWLVLLTMIGIGSLIGIISSLLATYKYLKI